MSAIPLMSAMDVNAVLMPMSHAKAVVAICPLREDDNVVEAIEGMYVQARPRRSYETL